MRHRSSPASSVAGDTIEDPNEGDSDTAVEANKTTEKILTQLTSKEKQMQAISSHVTTIEAQVEAAKDPAYKRKSFCDWVRTEVVTASEDEYEAFQGCFLSLHQNWL